MRKRPSATDLGPVDCGRLDPASSDVVDGGARFVIVAKLRGPSHGGRRARLDGDHALDAVGDVQVARRARHNCRSTTGRICRRLGCPTPALSPSQSPIHQRTDLPVNGRSAAVPGPSQSSNADCNEPKLTGGTSFCAMRLRLVELAAGCSRERPSRACVGRRRECPVFVNPAARQTSPETSALTRPLAASV
jgi:hypothetical protein